MLNSKVFFLAKHPLFGTKARKQPISSLERSPYYWWWQYLRRNKRYLGCCNRGGKGQLSALYADFGDVRSDDFKSWWEGDDNRGVRLFAEQIADYTVKELEDKDGWLDDFPQKRIAVLAVNLNLESNRAIKSQFDRWLKKKNPRSRGKPAVGKNSTAKYPLARNFSAPALKRNLEVFDMVESARNEAKRNKQKATPLWEIGHKLNLIPYIRKQKDQLDSHERSELSKTTSRYYRVAKELIAVTSQGKFP